MDSLALVLEAVASTSSRNRKLSALAEWMKTLDDADLERAVRFLSGTPVVGTEGRKMSVGYSVLREAAVAASGWDHEMVRLCHREVGDSGEAIGLLLRGKTREGPLSLKEAEVLYQRIFQARRAADKVELLRAAWLGMRPLTVKYFVKVITGNFRIGLQTKLVEEALAQSAGAKLSVLREASNRSGDLAAVAIAARRGTLDKLEARLFHPLEFMLARPLEAVEDLPEPQEWFVEDKYDGIRSQVHFDHGRVAIFTRGLEETTAAFPELTESFAQLAGSAILDGEVLAMRDGRALNFAVLQQRIARKQVSAALREEIPVSFIAYDLLYRNGELLLGQGLEERRRRLDAMPVTVSPQARLRSQDEIEPLFLAARARGNEGLMLKRAGSLYESGKRSLEWYKVKRPYGTLDVVITAAEQGSGKRATLLSDYTFAVREGERFLNVGKAYSGLTDEEIRALTRILKSLATERFGRVTLVRPEVVLEVAFDGIQKSPRHKSGYALRFPRIVRWRTDKGAGAIDTLERLQEMYEATLRA